MPVMPGDDRKYAGRYAAMSGDSFFVLGDGLWVRVLPMSDETTGGLVIPATGKRFSQRAEVLATGPGRWVRRKRRNGTFTKLRREPMLVKRGDLVVIIPQSGVEWTTGRKRYRHITQREVLAVLDDSAPAEHQVGPRDVL